jgi:hypothetical protein
LSSSSSSSSKPRRSTARTPPPKLGYLGQPTSQVAVSTPRSGPQYVRHKYVQNLVEGFMYPYSGLLRWHPASACIPCPCPCPLCLIEFCARDGLPSETNPAHRAPAHCTTAQPLAAGCAGKPFVVLAVGRSMAYLLLLDARECCCCCLILAVRSSFFSLSSFHVLL